MSALIGVVGVVIAVIAFLGPVGGPGRPEPGGPESPPGTSGVDSSGGLQPAPTPSSRPPGPQKLIDIPLVEDGFEPSFGPGPRKVNAVDYDEVYAAELLCYVVGSAADDEFQVDRKYDRFSTKVGLGDVGTASGIRVKFTVSVDGTATRSATVTVGEVKTIDVPVSGALRVSLRAEVLEEWLCDGRAVAAWVEPSFS